MLYVKVFELLHHIEVEFQALADDTGLSVIEVHVLRALYAENDQTASGLAQQVGRAATAFTPVLDRLEGKGFIERKKHPKDRRAITVSLTILGESLRQKVTEYANEADEDLLSELGVYLPVEVITEAHLTSTDEPNPVDQWMLDYGTH